MAQRITTAALEEETFVISYSLTDEDGDAVDPITLTWTLTDVDGTVINSRQDVAISSPTATGDVLLQGDDLAFQSGEENEAWRLITFEGTYNSDLGSGLAIIEEAWFRVVGLVAIT